VGVGEDTRPDGGSGMEQAQLLDVFRTCLSAPRLPGSSVGRPLPQLRLSHVCFFTGCAGSSLSVCEYLPNLCLAAS
jgi:hypothetical protein